MPRASDHARDLQHIAKIGDPEMSEGWTLLSDMLSAHGDLPISELAMVSGLPFEWDRGEKATCEKLGGTRKREKAISPPSESERPTKYPRSLSREEVERILDDDTLTKQQLAELGHNRFGISRSRLLRLRKDRARNDILSALRNERTMHVIHEQAGKTLRSA